MQFQRAMAAAAPDVEVDGDVGRSSSFEVTLDDGAYLAYSKLAKGVFPDYAALASEIAQFDKTGVAPASFTKLK